MKLVKSLFGQSKNWTPKKQILFVGLVIMVGTILYLIVDSLLQDNGMIPKDTAVILLLIFSYQNGFFWQTILTKTS